MEINDLISRSALREAMCGNLKRVATGAYFKLRNDAYRMERAIMEAIDAAHAVDAEPVRYGRWIMASNRTTKSHLRRCTACNIECYFCGAGCSYKYCPNCGAKMDVAEQSKEDK